MGRIKTTLIKRVTHELMRLHFNEFTDDFNKNKGIVNKFVSISSKKLRNAIAGYATRLIKKSKESKDTILNQY
ncbi:30S ribosomal protein S17e [Candidatus Woesearchaeota archaeon]|nr:30S ribosomal protein S17e [Candidatus Woesearchaeota archaeon]